MAEIDLLRLLKTLSSCLDFDNRGINAHHNRVCRISLNLADQIGLSRQEKNLVGTAAIIHDIGVKTWGERNVLLNFEVDKPREHCKNGAELVNKYKLLEPVADIILHHHDNFAGHGTGLGGRAIPLAARIIHLADRIDILLLEQYKSNYPILCRVERITEKIRKLSGIVFDPDLVEQFMLLSRCESFWLDLITPETLNNKLQDYKFPLGVGNDEILQLANLFADVIDRKSPFTYRHSRGVAGAAVLLGSSMGFTADGLVNMRIAGLLHDLGKLSIGDGILEKQGQLTMDEFTMIRQHPYYTYHILSGAGIAGDIAGWAAYHHEKLDGSGYPFHLDASQIPLGSRIIAAADVFTALREDRPYRRGMEKEAVIKIMRDMVLQSALDGDVVNTLLGIYNELDQFFNSL